MIPDEEVSHNIWHYHQLLREKMQGNQQTAELSIFVKFQWKL